MKEFEVKFIGSGIVKASSYEDAQEKAKDLGKYQYYDIYPFSVIPKEILTSRDEKKER